MTAATLTHSVRPERVRSRALVPTHEAGVARRLHSVPNSVVGASLAGGAAPVAVQHGFFDELLTTAAPGLLGAASSFLGGDSDAAMGQLKQTGAGAASGLVQQGAGALGGLVGGSAGEQISSIGAPVGQGLSSVITGESSAGEAAGGALTSLQPMILSLLTSLLRG